MNGQSKKRPAARSHIGVPALWALCLLAFVPGSRAQSGAPFQQDPLPDGVVSIEAEHFHTNAGSASHDWQPTADFNASGGTTMSALPNSGVNYNTGYVDTSPRLDLQVNFVTSGVHYIVVRGQGDSGSDDSLHAGIGGVANSTADRIAGFNRSNPHWSGETLDFDAGSGEFEQAWFTVPSPGVHTGNLWMREDGLNFDKFILTTTPGFVPADEGPPHGHVFDLEPVSMTQAMSRTVLSKRSLPCHGMWT